MWPSIGRSVLRTCSRGNFWISCRVRFCISSFVGDWNMSICAWNVNLGVSGNTIKVVRRRIRRLNALGKSSWPGFSGGKASLPARVHAPSKRLDAGRLVVGVLAALHRVEACLNVSAKRLQTLALFDLHAQSLPVELIFMSHHWSSRSRFRVEREPGRNRLATGTRSPGRLVSLHRRIGRSAFESGLRQFAAELLWATLSIAPKRLRKISARSARDQITSARNSPSDTRTLTSAPTGASAGDLTIWLSRSTMA